LLKKILKFSKKGGKMIFNNDRKFILVSISVLTLLAFFVFAVPDTEVDNIASPINASNHTGNLLLNATVNTTSDNLTFIFNHFSNASHFYNTTIQPDDASNTTFNTTIDTNSILTDGLFSVIVNANDTTNASFLGNITVSQLLIDNINPFVDTFNGNTTDRLNVTTADKNFTVNVTIRNGSTLGGVNVSDFHMVIFEISNGSESFTGDAYNITVFNGTGGGLHDVNDTLFNATFNISDLIDYNHTIRIYANDTAGNINNSQNISVVVDTTAPAQLDLGTFTENRSGNTSDTTPTFEWEVNDTLTERFICDVIYDDNVNFTNSTVSNGTLFTHVITTSMAEGAHNWSVSCNDSVNLNTGSGSTSFIIDTTNPFVDTFNGISIDRTNFTDTDQNFTINMTIRNGTTLSGINVTDINAVIVEISNGSSFGSNSFNITALSDAVVNDLNDTLFNVTINVSRLADANHTIRVYVNDSAGNVNNSESISIISDNRFPSVSDVTNLSVATYSVTVNWTTDEITNATVSYGKTVALGTDTSTTSFVSQHEFNITGLEAVQEYFYNVTSCDLVNKCNTTGPFNFTTAAGTTQSTSSSSGGGGGGGGCGTGYSKVSGVCVKTVTEPDAEPSTAAASEVTAPKPVVEEKQDTQEAPTRSADQVAADRAARDAAAKKGAESTFGQTLLDLSWLWVVLVVVAIGAGVGFFFHRKNN
jgi:hypothetical protein